jgi:two-component system chemotaxis sensor kinase CheA
MGLVKLQAVAHSAESLLSRLRAEEIRFNPPIATALLRVVDAIREILANVEALGGEGSADYTALAAEVDRLRETGGVATALADPRIPVAEATIEVRALPPLPQAVEEMREIAAPQLLVSPPSEPAPTTAPASGASLAIAAVPLASGETPEARAGGVMDAAIRVDVGLLDKLMTLVGELVLARNQILQHSSGYDDSGFLGAVQRLNLLTSELQASVMKTRMQPIGNVLNKFPRIVRDLSVACGKKVRFEMEGRDTELDKSLTEAIRDPLTHILRNAVDHGIEPPEVRRANGKAEEGRLRMLAYHQGGQVMIEVSDDGAGIDVTKVRDKAIAARLVSQEAASRMSRQDLLRLVFLPGFSTADRVTQFSGRGVGMDVVRTNIEKIGGAVEIESAPGQGTTIRTRIPLTLAIIPALIVSSGGERYAIPQASLLELVWLEPEQAQRGIEWLHGAPVYRLRGSLLPLVFLDEKLQLETLRTPASDLNIVVLQADDRPFGLVVDAIRDTEEIVVKPLQKQLKGIGVFAGAAIMGDGRIALVLDIAGLAHRAGVIAGDKDRALTDEPGPAPAPAEETQPLLLFATRNGGQMAIPLSHVARLEEFPRSRLERLGARRVVQYRGEVLPLIDVSHEMDLLEGRRDAANDAPGDWSETLPVVVYGSHEDRVGLIVGKILDIVTEPIAVRSRASRPGALFMSVVQDKVTEFIDVAALVREAKHGVGSSAT